MKKPNFETCSDEEFNAWVQYEDSKFIYKIFIPIKNGSMFDISYMNSEPLMWCEETFGDTWDLEDNEIDPSWVDDEGTPWWSWRSSDEYQNYGFEFYFQREDDAVLFVLIWKELNPAIVL